jgi:putative membrane protein
MHFKQRVEEWQGIFLVLISVTAALWLGATKQLSLYINPRYDVFTMIMAGIGALLAVVSFRHVHRLPITERFLSNTRTFITIGSLLICGAAAVDLLVFAPTTLTDDMATARGINNSVISTTPPTDAVPLFSTGDYSDYTITDWAGLLASTSNPIVFAGKAADITGFMSPDATDPQNVFFVTRFLITCCTIDAQPVGVPVYDPNWQNTYKAGQWIAVSGTFAANPSPRSSERIALTSVKIIPTAQPEDPYVYPSDE